MTARREASVARIGFGDGERNALDARALDGIASAIARATSNRTVRVIVLASTGAHFCSGLDLEAAFCGAAIRGEEIARAYAACVAAILDAPQPVIARVHGPALGGGCGLAAACDHVIASPEATFALPETILGMIPVVASTVLGRRCSPGAVRSLGLTGRTISAEDALRIGLVDDLVSPGTLDRSLDALLDRIARANPEALAATKRWLAAPRAELTRAADALAQWMQRDDVRSGVIAFASGDAPPWFAP